VRLILPVPCCACGVHAYILNPTKLCTTPIQLDSRSRHMHFWCAAEAQYLSASLSPLALVRILTEVVPGQQCLQQGHEGMQACGIFIRHLFSWAIPCSCTHAAHNHTAGTLTCSSRLNVPEYGSKTPIPLPAPQGKQNNKSHHFPSLFQPVY